MTDLRTDWHDHEDPDGYRVLYDDDGEALILIRLADQTEVGRYTNAADLLTAVETDRTSG